MTIVFIGMILLIFSACSNNANETSPIEGVSDEVYEQLVQQYFFWSTQTDIFLGDLKTDKKGTEWFANHELMDDAEVYAEEHDDISNPILVFPNPIIYEYAVDPDKYSETEQIYLEKMNDFIKASNRAMRKDYERLKKELKDDLEIDEADNIFDVS